MKDEMSRIIPQRIVPLACGNAEILFALGLGSSVVGVDDWSDFSPPVGDLPRVGPDLKIDMAKIAALKAGRIRCFPEEPYGRPGPRLVEGLERLWRRSSTRSCSSRPQLFESNKRIFHFATWPHRRMMALIQE